MVTVRTKALSDRRLVRLSQLATYPGGDDEALGKMTRLWALCAELQTNTPEVRDIRACLGPHGEEHLVESGLGDDKHRDPTLGEGVYRVRGCDETDWYFARLEHQGKVEAGRARAEHAERDARGRFAPDPVPPPDPSGSSTVPASSLSGSSSLSYSGASGSGAREAAPEVGPGRARQDRRRRLFGAAWQYAGGKHNELRNAGVDPTARNCWGGMPSASSTEAQNLFSIIDSLTESDAPNWEQAEEVIRNRIDVAAAEARRDGQLRWFIPARMWDRKSFDIAKDLSPSQAAQPRTGRLNDPTRASQPVRRLKTF